jgi:hypothetical protein
MLYIMNWSIDFCAWRAEGACAWATEITAEGAARDIEPAK